MKKLIYILFLIVGFTNAQQLAFPSSEGFGRFSIGGRGGTVVKVTNLNDSGAGSFRVAVSSSNRIVIFEIAGYIDLESTVPVSDTITIAGQTAFRNGGQGITLRKSSVSPFSGAMLSGGTDLIVRYIRLRPGQRQNDDCCGDAWLFYNKNNIILDHVSGSYSSDELLDFSFSSNITIQYSFFSEPLSEVIPASAGKLFMMDKTENVTFYRTLAANSGQRNPAITPNANTSVHTYEFVNNYSFNLGSFALIINSNGTTPINLNIINNYWHEPTNLTSARRRIMLATVTDSEYYVADNNFDNRRRPTQTGDVWDLLTSITGDYGSNFTVPQNTAYQTLTAHNTPIVAAEVSLIDGLSLWATLKDDFGCSTFRDAADIRVIDQIIADSAPDYSTAPLDESDFGTAYSALNDLSSVPLDTSGDGMPDDWKTDNGLNPATDDSSYAWGNGYIGVEVYLNGLVGESDGNTTYPLSLFQKRSGRRNIKKLTKTNL